MLSIYKIISGNFWRMNYSIELARRFMRMDSDL